MARPSAETNECVSIRYGEVPPFLRTSAFYLQLAAEDEQSGPSDIPSSCFKADITVDSIDDFRLLLHTMVFWGLDVIPDSILDFCHNNDLDVWQAAYVALSVNSHLHSVLTDCYSGTESVLSAADSGHPEIVQHWMRVHPPENLTKPTQPCTEVACIGNLQVLKELHENDYPWDAKACEAAAGSGKLKCLMYLHEEACPWDETACAAAAAKGHLDCLRFLHEHGCPWHEDEICYNAAEAGHLSCLKFAHEHGGILDEGVTLTPHIDCLRYALEHNCPFHEDGWIDRNCPELPLEHVKLYQEHGVVWPEDICVASLEWSLEHTQHFIRQGCPYKREIIHDAVWVGTPEHLQYLIDEALLEMSAELFSEAVMTGSLGHVQVLVDRGCPCDFVWHMELDGYRLYDERILPCIQYVAERGWACSEELIGFVFGNNLPLCWEYMRHQGIVDSTKMSPYDRNYVHKPESDEYYQALLRNAVS